MKYDVLVNNNYLKIKEADTFFKRFMGLMFKKRKTNYGLLFKNTNGIHTFFMFQSIDVVLFDKDFNVSSILKDVKPWRVILPKKEVKHVLELPLGYIKILQDKKIL